MEREGVGGFEGLEELDGQELAVGVGFHLPVADLSPSTRVRAWFAGSAAVSRESLP